jgi:pyridoxal biosynthesis lyase PdxS
MMYRGVILEIIVVDLAHLAKEYGAYTVLSLE